MKNKSLLILSGLFSVFLFIRCSKTDSTGISVDYCAAVNSNYNSDVQPLITTYCLLGSNCHSPGSTNTGGELTDYTKIFAKRTAIRDAVYSGVMPQTGSLTTDQKKKIVCWIDDGAPNN